MPWIKMPGIEGLVYEPPHPPAERQKHVCQDCYSCQMCSDVRCAACRNGTDDADGAGKNKGCCSQHVSIRKSGKSE